MRTRARVDTTFLSLGAGVQSTTLALMACMGELEPMPDHIIFADTGDETDATYKHLAWLEEFFLDPSGLGYHRVSAGNIRDEVTAVLHDQTAKTGRIGQPPFQVQSAADRDASDSGRLWRKCTSEYKIGPIVAEMRRLLGVGFGERVPKGVTVTRLLGLSIDEAHRMKPSRHAWETTRWPLIEMEMTRWDCYRWLEKHDYPIPPRSACRICPNHNDAYWRELAETSPAEFEGVCGFDDELRRGRIPGTHGSVYIHRSCQPLRDVNLSDHGQTELDLWGGECEGICGL